LVDAKIDQFGEISFPVVNFNNILVAVFVPIFFARKLQSQIIRTEILHKTLLHRKADQNFFTQRVNAPAVMILRH